jgi:hypothetical protein
MLSDQKGYKASQENTKVVVRKLTAVLKPK